MKLISESPFILKYIIAPLFFIISMGILWSGLFSSQYTPVHGLADRSITIWSGAAVGIYTLISGLSDADEVWDAGDALVVRKYGRKERIPLANILSLTHKKGRPPYSIITLRVTCRFGRKITFITILSGVFNWSGPPDPALYDDLPVRIHEARRNALRDGSAFRS